MNDWNAVITAALLAESVWETSKLAWQKGKMNPNVIGALTVGIIIAVGAHLNICTVVGINFSYPMIGEILTGILLSRGSNFIHDLFNIAQRVGSTGYTKGQKYGTLNDEG